LGGAPLCVHAQINTLDAASTLSVFAGKGTRPEKLDSSQKKYLKVTVLGASAAKKGELSVKLLFTGSSSVRQSC